MIRVVLDTNIVVSAMLSSGGFPEAIFNLAIDRVIQLYISEPILAEYEEVLNRPRLKIHPDKVANALVRIREAGTPVSPTTPVTAASDPDDNIFLECAVAAEAHYLVTGNWADFPDKWASALILTPRQFLEVITDAQRGDPPNNPAVS
jgi:putative PIN family toxin of toxin-antitoxin system